MSFFQEKDHFIKKAFEDIFNHDSDDSDEEEPIVSPEKSNSQPIEQTKEKSIDKNISENKQDNLDQNSNHRFDLLIDVVENHDDTNDIHIDATSNLSPKKKLKNTETSHTDIYKTSDTPSFLLSSQNARPIITVIDNNNLSPDFINIEDDCDDPDSRFLRGSFDKTSDKTSDPDYTIDEPGQLQESGLRRSRRSCVRKRVAVQQARRNKSKSSKRSVPQDSGDVVIILSDDESNGHDSSIISSNNNINDSRSNTSRRSSNKLKNSSTNTSLVQDPDDYEFNFKLMLAGSYQQFPTTYKTKLLDILRPLLNELDAKEKRLIIQTPKGDNISLMESPFSLKLTPGVILKAIEISLNSNNMDDFSDCDTAKDPNSIRVKIQDGNRKNTKEFTISKDEPLYHLKEQYAQEFGIDSLEQIKFSFDGDMVEDESTPDDLDIEDDCVIDVMIC